MLASCSATLRLSAVSKTYSEYFAYHGAEHKSISALEADAALDAERQCSNSIPRIRAAARRFLLQSMLTSTAVYAAVGNRTPLGASAPGSP